jgi:hypothetical protein
MDLVRSEQVKEGIAKNKKPIECLECHKIVSCKQAMPQHLKACCGLTCEGYAKKWETEEWVSCPICEKKFYRTLLQQHMNQNKGCSKECRTKIRMQEYKETCMKTYGVSNVLKVDSVKKTSEQTCLERYGSPHYFTSEEGKQVYKERSIELFGTEHPMQSEEVQNRLKKSNLETYGVENIYASDYFHDLMKEKYGGSEKSQKSISGNSVQKISSIIL